MGSSFPNPLCYYTIKRTNLSTLFSIFFASFFQGIKEAGFHSDPSAFVSGIRPLSTLSCFQSLRCARRSHHHRLWFRIPQRSPAWILPPGQSPQSSPLWNHWSALQKYALHYRNKNNRCQWCPPCCWAAAGTWSPVRSWGSISAPSRPPSPPGSR